MVSRIQYSDYKARARDYIDLPYRQGKKHLNLAVKGEGLGLFQRVGHLMFGVVEHTPLLNVVMMKTEQRLHKNASLSTTTFYDRFTNARVGSTKKAALQHFTSYPKAKTFFLKSLFTRYFGARPIPTDHGGIVQIKREKEQGYRIAIADAQGGHGRGKEAKEVASEAGNAASVVVDFALNRVSMRSQEKNLGDEAWVKGSFENIGRMPVREHRPRWVKDDYRWQALGNATCLIEAEITKEKDSDKRTLKLFSLGGSEVIVISKETGKLLFSIDSDELKKQGTEGHSLGLGGNSLGNGVENGYFCEKTFNEPVFVLACSDGLSGHFRGKDMKLNEAKLLSAVWNGSFSGDSDATSVKGLNSTKISDNLRNAVMGKRQDYLGSCEDEDIKDPLFNLHRTPEYAEKDIDHKEPLLKVKNTLCYVDVLAALDIERKLLDDTTIAVVEV